MGIVDSSGRPSEPSKLGPRPWSSEPSKILIPSEPRANPLAHPKSLFPHLGCVGTCFQWGEGDKGQSRNPMIFVFFNLFGRKEAGNTRKMSIISTPGEPIPENCWLRPFSGYLDPPWIFDFALSMTIPWDLGLNRVAHLVHGSSRREHGHSGFLGKALQAFETRTSTVVL